MTSASIRHSPCDANAVVRDGRIVCPACGVDLVTSDGPLRLVHTPDGGLDIRAQDGAPATRETPVPPWWRRLWRWAAGRGGEA